MNPLVRIAAYEADPASGDWLKTFRTIKFSDEWRDEALALHALSWRGADERLTLPIAQLNSLLRAAAPGVIATGRGAATDANTPWLYATNEVPADLVAALVNTWVATLGPGKPNPDPKRQAELEEAVFKVQASLVGSMPSWSESSVNLTAADLSPGGTALPDRPLYQVVPEVLAAELARRPYRDGDEELHFRVVTRDQGAELVSWPPRPFTKKGRQWYYSCVITLTVQTVPFTSRFRVHVGTGVRRWATGGRFQVPANRGVGAYLAVAPPWSTGHGHTPRLSNNFIDYFERGNRHAWRSRSTVELLPELDIVRTYPSAFELVSDPDRWLDGVDGLTAAVVHSNGLTDHEVKAGVGPTERARLDRWVELGLQPWFRRVTDLERTGHRAKPAIRPKPRWTKVEGDDAATEARRMAAHAEAAREAALARRAALGAALDGAPLEVHLLWQNERTRDKLISVMCDLLDLPELDVETLENWHWGTENLRIRVVARKFDSAEASALSVPKATGIERARLVAEAINGRRRRVRRLFETDLDPVRTAGLVFVELHNREAFTAADSDPKTAIRLGCADAGRLSQFISKRDDDDGELLIRARSSWLDGLRQLGAITTAAHRVDGVPDGTQVAALWMANRRADGVTRRAHRELVVVRLEQRNGHYHLEAWHDEEKQWMPYRRYLVELPKKTAMRSPGRKSLRDQRWVVERQVRSVLYQLRNRPTMLLANSENLRWWWSWISNRELVRDMIGFGDDPPQRLAAWGPDLRLVLIRNAGGRDEVPQWYAPAPDDKSAGFAAGIWRQRDAGSDNRVFASLTDVPASAKTTKRTALKILTGPEWTRSPGKAMWNPRYVEITVAGCLSEGALAVSGRADVAPDNPADWAALAHQFRLIDDYVPLSQPAALHWAALAEEYMLPTVSVS
ncbi:pPIWI_RE module domain-containing protein [Saccharothrix longispora]|uniref:DUF3962 domain-containing protein n=1 Tax=Saccharothrix longispora TaxID=33920 RepID=A0ABU1PM71_9PSEU|nr:DUF3962 domain-containing protein [Saccharothrix longispora]MDR6591762.1 hypothetical protein [Saccharothrix longispora]